MTACPLGAQNAYNTIFKEMRNIVFKDGKKLTDSQIVDKMIQSEVVKAIQENPGNVTLVIAALGASDFNTRNAAKEAVTTWEIDFILSQKLNTNQPVIEAFKEKGIDITAFDTPWLEVDLDDTTKITKYVMANNPDAVKFVNAIMTAATTKVKDTTQLKKTINPSTGKLYTEKEAQLQLTEDDTLTAIMLIDILAKGGMERPFGDNKMSKISNIDNVMKAYDDYYKNVMNIMPEKLELGKTANGTAAIVWQDGFGKQKDLPVIDDNGNALDPFTMKYRSNTPDKEGNQFIQQKMYPNPKDKYTYVLLNETEYANLILQTITQLQTTRQTQENIDKIGNAFSSLAFDTSSALWTCVGNGCPGSGGGSSGGSSGGSGGSGDSGGSSGGSTKTPAKTNVLLVDTGAVKNVAILANGNSVGISNEPITLDVGSYTIVAKLEGYETETFALQLGEYPVTKQLTMRKMPLGINAFLNGIGGRQNLTNNHVFYVYCAIKELVTTDSAWRSLPRNIEPAITTMIERPTKYDVQYLRYLVQGNDTAAKLLVDEGKVTL